jgi:hypothetical protein
MFENSHLSDMRLPFQHITNSSCYIYMMNNSDLIEKKGLNPCTRRVYNMDSTL